MVGPLLKHPDMLLTILCHPTSREGQRIHLLPRS